MSKPYYECHITFMGGQEQEQLVRDSGWIFSKIDGDPLLGEGVKCYATRQYSTRWPQWTINGLMFKLAWKMRGAGIKVLREKIELVVYDKRHK